MEKLQKNPFRFGDPVEGAYYLPRPELEKTVCQFLANRIHVVLVGPRRFGKTSFVLNLLQNLEKQSYTSLFVDIYNITSHKDFLQQILRALNTKKNWKDSLKSWLKSISSIYPKLTVNFDPQTNQPSFGLAFSSSSEEDVKEQIQDILASIEKLGEKIVFCIDEFQKISEINDNGWLEATLRTHMQQNRNTAFLLTGSRRSVIYDMLNNQSRPLYRSCQPIEFPSFGEEFTDWIVYRFSEVGITCDKEAISHLRRLVQDTPNYVQMVSFHLVAQGKKHITISDVETTLNMAVRQNAYAYQTLLNTLTPIQQRVLRLASKEAKQVFSKENRIKYEISSGAALASAIKSLKDKGILDEDGTKRGEAIFDDPLFSIWLKISFEN